MHREYRLSVITVNYNGLRDTCALLDHLTFDHNDTEVIVVDNGSANNEAETIASRYANVKCIRSERNLGFAGGNNLGIRHAQGTYNMPDSRQCHVSPAAIVASDMTRLT